MAVRIVSLLAKIGFDGTQFQQGLRKAGQLMGDFGFSAGTLKHQLAGVFSVFALERLGHHLLNAVTRFKDLSEQLNISTEEAQIFDAAAMHSGQRLEDLSGPLNKLAAARKNAAEGDEDLRATFLRMGVTLDDLQNPMLRNIDLMRKIAEFIQKVNFTAREAAEFRELFGKSGQRIAAIFRDLENVHIQPISDEDVQKIHDMHHALEMLRLRLTAFAAGGVNLKPEDFFPNWLLTLGNPQAAAIGERFSKRSAPAAIPGMSNEEVAAENARRHFRDQQAFEDDKLFREKDKEKQAAQLQKQMLELQQKLQEKLFQIELKRANVARQRALLEVEISRHFHAAFIAKNQRDEKTAAEELLKALELRTELDSLKAETGKPRDFQLSSAEQIGAFSGITAQRGFALSQPSIVSDTREIKRGVLDTAAILKHIDSKIKVGATSDSFF